MVFSLRTVMVFGAAIGSMHLGRNGHASIYERKWDSSDGGLLWHVVLAFIVGVHCTLGSVVGLAVIWNGLMVSSLLELV
jgi:hypothetical protein